MIAYRGGGNLFLVVFGVLFALVFLFAERLVGVDEFHTLAFAYGFGWVLFFAYIISLYRRMPELLAAMLWQFLYFAGMLVSSTIISLGGDMYEIQAVGFANGIFWVVLLFFLVSCESQVLGLIFSRRVCVSRGVLLSRTFEFFVAKFFVYITLGLSFFILLRYGSPLLIGVNRIQYWGDVAPAYFSFVRVLVICTFFLISYFVVSSDGQRRGSIWYRLLLVLYIFLAFVLFGEKFSLFVFYIFAWLLLSSAVRGRREVRRTLRVMVFIFVFLLVNVGVVYELMGLGFEFIARRTPSEGQVLWSVLNENISVIGCGLYCSNTSGWTFLRAREFIDGRYLPLGTYLLNQITGTSLTGYFPSWQVLAFGLPISVVFHFLVSVLFGFVQGSVVSAIRQKRLLQAFLFYIFYFFLIAFWYVGNFNLLPALLFVLFLIIVFNISFFSFAKMNKNVCR